MLKHKEILDKMSAKQKIALITNIGCLADDEYNDLGIPRLEMTTINELFDSDGEGLTPALLARSWDPHLISMVTEQVIAHSNCKDINAISVPSPKIDFGGANPSVLSEDPLLASKVSAAFLSAVNNAKKAAILPDFYLNNTEIASLDTTPDKKALEDFLIHPFVTAASNGGADAVICSISKNSGEYTDINRSLMRGKEKHFSPDTVMLCLCRTYDETLLALEENCIMIRGVDVAIQNAYDQYLTLKSAVEKGSASMINLEEAFEHKTAISDEMLDAAAEKVIDFAYRFGKIRIPEEPAVSDEENAVPDENTEQPIEAPTPVVQPKYTFNESEPIQPFEPERFQRLKTFAIEKSTVILKNKDNILPLKPNTKYAIIGDAAFTKSKNSDQMFLDHFIASTQSNCIGCERGYDLHEDKSENLIAPAVALARKAGTVFVFLKLRDQRSISYHNTVLPANQIALLEAISSCKCNIIAVVAGDTNLNLTFDEYTDGLLLAPIAGRCSADALSHIVFGRVSPGGKITTTFYTSPETFFKKQRFYKNNKRNKVGPFMGYRFYDTQNIGICYPFGFGLHYSTVEFSNFKISGKRITFTASNTGSFAIDDTVEIYLGMTQSKLARPKKELKAFSSLHLNPRESKTITINDFDYSVYDEKNDAYVSESGSYVIYLGESVSDIYLSVKVSINGKTIFRKAQVLSDYLQSESNIISNEFTLEAKHKKMTNHKSIKNAGLFCLLAAAIVALMSISAGIPLIPITVASIFLFVSLILFIVSKSVKDHAAQIEAELMEKNKDLFLNADSVSSDKLDELFAKEFDAEIIEIIPKSDDDDEVYVETRDAHVNEAMSFTLAASDLKKSAAENGIGFTLDTSSSIIAAFAASKLLFIKSSAEERLNSFVECVTNYFGANLYIENVTEAHRPQDRLLRITAEDGNSAPSSVLNALLSATENREKMHIIYLKGIGTDKISDYITPYIRYFSNPGANAEISAKGSDEIYAIPSNVWFVCDLEVGKQVEEIPSYVLEYAIVLPVKYSETEACEEKSVIVPITPADFDHLSEKCRSKLALTEDIWKKIDTIESFASKYSSYKIGNKFWLQIETYISILTSVNTEMAVAVDNTLASVILPVLASTLVGKTDGSEKTIIDEAERVFGEDNIPLCHDVIVSER